MLIFMFKNGSNVVHGAEPIKDFEVYFPIIVKFPV